MERHSDQVIVITEATHGAARAIALELAKDAVYLVLSSNNSDALASLEGECRQLGASVAVQVAQMNSTTEMLALSRFASDRYGHIDAWISYLSPDERPAPLSHASAANFGYEAACYENGAAAAVDAFSRQQRGLLINLDALTLSSVAAGAGAGTGELATSASRKSALGEVFHRVEKRASQVPGMLVRNVSVTSDRSGSERAVSVVVALLHTQRDMLSSKSFSERERPAVILDTGNSRGEGHWRLAETQASWEGWSTAALIIGAIAVAVGAALFFAS